MQQQMQLGELIRPELSSLSLSVVETRVAPSSSKYTKFESNCRNIVYILTVYMFLTIGLTWFDWAAQFRSDHWMNTALSFGRAVGQPPCSKRQSRAPPSCGWKSIAMPLLVWLFWCADICSYCRRAKIVPGNSGHWEMMKWSIYIYRIYLGMSRPRPTHKVHIRSLNFSWTPTIHTVIYVI